MLQVKKLSKNRLCSFILSISSRFLQVILSKIRTGSSLQEFRCSGARNKLRTGVFHSLLNHSTEYLDLPDMPACQFIKNKKKHHHFCRKQAKRIKEHPSVFGRIHNFASALLLSTKQLFFFQTTPHNPEHFRIADKNTPHNTFFFVEQLPVSVV